MSALIAALDPPPAMAASTSTSTAATADAATADAADVAEEHRRRMLTESDALLDQVEELRLGDRMVCPASLAEAVRSLQVRLGRVEAGRPRTVRAAHNLVFAIQARLMAANPRNPRPRPQPGRPAGVPRVAVLRRGGAWKFLALPPPPPSIAPEARAEWWHLVQLTVQRAQDRWSCAQGQAVAAARARRGATRALSRARAAWRNYWELRCEAESILTRTRRLGGARREASIAARSP